ncbi:hypothetical protein SLA2020_495680 [Shorea laevis]
MASLSSDLFYDILRRLDGPTLASAACTCAAFCSISKEEKLWENVCSSMWPSTNREDVKSLISSIGGFRKFYADCFPLIVNKEVTENQLNNCLSTLKNGVRLNTMVTWMNLKVFHPQILFLSWILGIKIKQYAQKSLGHSKCQWLRRLVLQLPFSNDLLTYAARDDENDAEVTLSVSDGLPLVASMEEKGKMGSYGGSSVMDSGLAGLL